MEEQQEKVAAVSKKGVVKAKRQVRPRLLQNMVRKEGLDRKSHQKDS